MSPVFQNKKFIDSLKIKFGGGGENRQCRIKQQTIGYQNCIDIILHCSHTVSSTLSRRCHDEARFEMAVVRSSELSMKRSSTGARQHDTREGRERKLNSEVYVWHIQSFPITFSICSRVNDICYCDIPSFVGNLCVSLCHCQ